MREIELTKQFKRDYKKISITPRHRDVDSVLNPAMTKLALDLPLEHRLHDHPLSGDYAHHRECHLKPDLLLIYRKPDDATLRLVRLGSHSELF